ncbi:Voltage-dependent T-type calcium channel subunit alpha-1H [Durusdinium trenchii]|uniref:Voltage-dependent T-type calcium channel subunit alpha-1H n=1 Tax=Durusdinium trenchii TaxID=1381693 RepID=A0ABP0IV32_9DINO
MRPATPWCNAPPRCGSSASPRCSSGTPAAPPRTAFFTTRSPSQRGINSEETSRSRKTAPMQLSRRDYHGVGQEGILIARNLGQQNRFRVVLVFSTPEDKWPYWAAPFFHWLTDTLHKAALRFLNRPLVQQMRAIDANLYMVLGMRSFNRGPPLLPEKEDSSESISISNKSGDVTHWTRLKRKFRMTEYLHSFMAALGYDLKTYQSLEGRTLVNYQCVVLRKDWETHRAAFVEAFSLQKAAYRRANGGTTAPSLVEDARANFISEGSNASDSPSPMIVKTVVRKTFLELEEEELEKFSEIPLRRSKSDSFGDGWTSILSEGLQK